MHTNPKVKYRFREIPTWVSSESLWRTSKTVDIVKRTSELTIKGVNFWALRKNAKKALKASWVVLISANVDNGR